MQSEFPTVIHPFVSFIPPGSFPPTMNRTCNESSEEQNGAGRHQVAADDESREKESVDETALVVDGSAVEGFPEAQVVAEVLRHEVCKPKFAYNSLRIIISALPARPCTYSTFISKRLRDSRLWPLPAAARDSYNFLQLQLMLDDVSGSVHAFLVKSCIICTMLRCDRSLLTVLIGGAAPLDHVVHVVAVAEDEGALHEEDDGKRVEGRDERDREAVPAALPAAPDPVAAHGGRGRGSERDPREDEVRVVGHLGLQTALSRACAVRRQESVCDATHRRKREVTTDNVGSSIIGRMRTKS